MKLFAYRIRWSQPIRETIDQDESRLVGSRRVYSDLNIVAPTRALADEEANERYKFYDPEIKSVSEHPIHALITVQKMNHYTVQGGLPSPEAKEVR